MWALPVLASITSRLKVRTTAGAVRWGGTITSQWVMVTGFNRPSVISISRMIAPRLVL